jgi:hypothetical protein
VNLFDHHGLPHGDFYLIQYLLAGALEEYYKNRKAPAIASAFFI